jgi:hypothetical protein
MFDSPCLEPTDAKILSVLKRKPKHMSAKDWENLCAYSFGTVIFGLPKSSDDVPIPVSCYFNSDFYFALIKAFMIYHSINQFSA